MGGFIVNMGKGRDGDGCCGFKVRDPLFVPEFYGALFLLVTSFIWFVCMLDGINKIPKCRYGEDDCYFTVSLRMPCALGKGHFCAAVSIQAVEKSVACM